MELYATANNNSSTSINPLPHYDEYADGDFDEDGDFDDEDYWENMALQQEVGRQFGLREVAEDDTYIAIEEKQEVIKDKQEEIYGESGYVTGFEFLTAQLNSICHALYLDIDRGATLLSREGTIWQNR